MRRTRDDLVRGWLEKARRDLATAQSQLRVAEPPADIICFHAQQAAEKYLKAYLVWRGIEFPWRAGERPYKPVILLGRAGVSEQA